MGGSAGKGARIMIVPTKKSSSIGRGLSLVCVIKIGSGEFWFASNHNSEVSEGFFVSFLQDDRAMCLQVA